MLLLESGVVTGDEAVFLAAIRRRPADDTVKLVYADWLDENGQDDRAAWPRAEVEFSRRLVPSRFHRDTWPDCDCPWHALRRRILVLSRAESVRQWASGIPFAYR